MYARSICSHWLTVLVLVVAVPAAAQTGVLHGIVTDAETGAPLNDVHVFIAGTMQGDLTDSNGRFRLSGLSLGAHRVYASRLGYRPAQRDRVLTTAADSVHFALVSRPIEGATVDVVANVDGRALRRWQRRKATFLRLFLGESIAADSCKVLNPEVLTFSNARGRFTASASAPLVIENRYLGYRILYFLERFEYVGTTLTYDGEPLFEPLAPRDASEATRWAAQRKRAYQGSFRHFLHALIAGRTEAEGFLTFTRPPHADFLLTHDRWPAPPSRLLNPHEHRGGFTLAFNGSVEVIFMGEPESERFRRWQQWRPFDDVGNQRSWLELNDGPAWIDPHGQIPDPEAVTLYGHFAFERVADQLPKEYRPGGGF